MPLDTRSFDAAGRGIINFVVPTHSDRDDKNLDPIPVHTINDASLSGSHAAASCELPTERLTGFVRLTMNDALIDDFKDRSGFDTPKAD
jgi:hypothetical protein